MNSPTQASITNAYVNSPVKRHLIFSNKYISEHVIESVCSKLHPTFPLTHTFMQSFILILGLNYDEW